MKTNLIGVAEMYAIDCSGGDLRHAHNSVRDAARMLGCSESTVRRNLRQAGVRRVRGRVVYGYAIMECNGRRVSLMYSR